MIRLYTALKKIDIIRLSYIYIQNEQVLQNYKTKVLILNIMATNFIAYKRKGILFFYNKISSLFRCNMIRKSRSYECCRSKWVSLIYI